MPKQVTGQGGSVTLALMYTCREDLCAKAKEDLIPTCFAGTEILESELRGQIPFSDLKFGERILTAKCSSQMPSSSACHWVYQYSNVISLPHQRNNVATSFVQIRTTEYARDIRLTMYHLLFAGKCGSKLLLVYASSVRIGDCVLTVDGEDRVLSASISRGHGIYTAITAGSGEYLVVNGIIASPFALNHEWVDFLYGTLRYAYIACPAVISSQAFIDLYSQLSLYVSQQLSYFMHL